MTKAEVQALIDSKLATGTEIQAIEHREVETAILDYIDNIVVSMPLKRGTVNIGDVPSIGKLVDCTFNSPALDTNSYIVAGSLHSQGNLSLNGNCYYTVTGKTASGFSIFVKEIGNVTQDSLRFDYVVFSF